MKLRTRLSLVLLLLSVVPLAAVTIFSYVNNLEALQDTAAREADLLASELSARMELITAELSDQVERLLDMPAPAPAPAKPAAPNAAPAPTVSADAQAAQMLGDAALLLDHVEMQGIRRGGGRGGGRGSGSGARSSGAGQTTNDASRPANSNVTRGFIPPPRNDQSSSATPPPVSPPAQPATPVAAAVPQTSAPGGTPPSGSPPRGQRPPPQPITPLDTSRSDADHVVIDMAPIIHDIAQRLAPDGTSQMTPEQRQQFMRQLSERVTGIQEGIRLSVAELQKRADEAKKKANATEPSATEGAEATHRQSALAGNRLDVTVERNGHVRKANAQINLDTLLMTIFSTTKRDLGEVPFAVAKDGKLYTANDKDRRVVQSLGVVATPKGKLGRTILPNYVVVTTADPSGSGLRFGIARPVGDSIAELRKKAGRNAGLGLLFIGLAFVIVVPVSQRLTRNLSMLTEGVQQIARGDLGARVLLDSPNDEVGTLARAVNQMAQDLEGHQHALVGQERIKRELELGRQIQNEMLPHGALRLGLTEIRGVSVPAREVGGDFFNYFELPTREIALLVGDVSGKGVGAALVMANIQAMLRTRLALEQDLPAIADAIDRDMDAGGASKSAYATLFVGIFDPITRRLRYVNAGHHPQYALRTTGNIERMSSTGIPVGLLAGRGYVQNVLQLGPGDLLFFYTDGLVENEDEHGDFFGAQRLETVLIGARDSAAVGIDDVLSRVERAVSVFRGTREPFDDATMMAVRVG